jgi:hypothetical protein
MPAFCRGSSCSMPCQVVWDLWWTKWHWGGFSPSSSGSSANPHCTKCSILIYHPGTIGQLVADMPSGLGLIPPKNKKKKSWVRSGSLFIRKCWYSNFQQLNAVPKRMASQQICCQRTPNIHWIRMLEAAFNGTMRIISGPQVEMSRVVNSTSTESCFIAEH